MANENGWGDGSVNNSIGWGKGAINNSIGWGSSQLTSWSGATDIDGGNAPTNTVAPAITGTAQEGQTLTCSTGTWTGSPTYTYQWKRNGNNIGSATNSTYTLVTADVSQSIKCTVTATNILGSASADSNTVIPISAFSYLLDTYSGASAAYSLRKLRSAYSGNCIRVRRSSDNTEQDFGFVNNVLNTASLLTFCGAGNGFVTTWYDQSGSGNNTTQSNAVQQPQIVSSGAILTQNSKPIVQFDGSNDILISSVLSGGFFDTSQFNVLRIPSQSAEDIPFGYGNTGDSAKVRVMYCSSGQKLGNATWGTDYVGTLNSVDTNLYMYGVTQVSSSIVMNKNNTQITGSLGGTPQITTTGRYCIGSLNGAAVGNYYTNMNSAEFIFYPSNQSTNRTGIQNNINSFYTLW